MIRTCLFLISLLGLSSAAFSNNIQLNQTIPPISITDKGELVLNNEAKLIYQPWSSQQLIGKVRTIQHIAGRSASKELNAPLVEAIKQAKLPHDVYQTTTIVNTDDAMFGTGVFVNSSIEDSKKEYPYSQFIVDADAIVKQAWNLSPESSAIIILNKQGKVLFFKDGALTPQEIHTVIGLLFSELAK